MSESEMQIMSNKAVVDGHQIGYAGELVTIATFPEPAEASVARAALESAGINVFLLGESANMMIPVAFTAQLQVRAEDEVAARSILEAMKRLRWRMKCRDRAQSHSLLERQLNLFGVCM
jgi:hypothetical protein